MPCGCYLSQSVSTKRAKTHRQPTALVNTLTFYLPGLQGPLNTVTNRTHAITINAICNSNHDVLWNPPPILPSWPRTTEMSVMLQNYNPSTSAKTLLQSCCGLQGCRFECDLSQNLHGKVELTSGSGFRQCDMNSMNTINSWCDAARRRPISFAHGEGCVHRNECLSDLVPACALPGILHHVNTRA